MKHYSALLILFFFTTSIMILTSCSKEQQAGPAIPPPNIKALKKQSLMPTMPDPYKPTIKKIIPTTIPPLPKATLHERTEIKTDISEPVIIKEQTTATFEESSHKKVESKHSTHSSDNPNEIDFDVKNRTGKTLWISCFAWQRKHNIHRWRWDKSDVYEINPGQIVTVDVDTIPDPQDRALVFGYLAVHDNKEDADNATYELLDESNKLDLDRLINLKGKKVTLMIQQYGFKGDFFEYDFVDKGKKDEEEIPELDFAVINKTGKTIIVTCFVYQKKAKGSWLGAVDEKDDMAIWRFGKTPLLKLKPEQVGIIDVDTIPSERDRSYVRGTLAVFEEFEEDEARQATYELLESHRKLNIGDINNLKNHKVVIKIEKYGFLEDFLDYTVKPIRHIDFATVRK